MIPFRTGHRIPMMKEADSRLRQHDTDIDRLWRLQQQLSEGTPVGGELPPVFGLSSTPQRGSGEWLWAKTTSSITPGTYSSPTPFTANVWVPDPTSVTLPRKLVVTTDPNWLGITCACFVNASINSGVAIKIEIGPEGMWSLKYNDC